MVERNDESRGTYDANSDIKFKTSMIRTNLCGCSNACIYVKASITVPSTTADDAPVKNANKKVTFKNCSPFTNCISEINNIQLDDAQDIDVVMPMYNLIEYTDFIRKHQEVYGNTIEMNQHEMIIKILLNFLIITITVFHSNLKTGGTRC